MLGGSSGGDVSSVEEQSFVNGCTLSSGKENNGVDFSERLDHPLSRDEIEWAMHKVKKDAAPGKDGIIMSMMLADGLFDVWSALFEVCWEYGMAPSAWKESLVVPVPKKQSKGTCEVNTFRAISLTSMVSKVLCTILNTRLSLVAEEDGLIAEKQGGFRKQRGCRDQILSLILLGQMEMAKTAKGMFVAFIDFTKAYDKADRVKMWGCLEQMGVSGRFLRFLKALYQDNSCRVGDKLSEEFVVNTGLRQGCVLSPLLFSDLVHQRVGVYIT